MATEAFTVRAETSIVHKLDHIAGSLDRSRNYLVNQAINEYLESHAWQIEKITQGIEAADCGQLVGHDQVMQEIEALVEQKTTNKV